MFSQRGGRKSGGFDARTKIEARRRAQGVQEKVAKIRGQRQQQRRFSEGDTKFASLKNRGPIDLSTKLANSRRKRLLSQQQQSRGGTKNLPNFTVVANADNRSSPVIKAIVRKLDGTDRDLGAKGLRRTIHNEKAVQAPPISRATEAVKRRSAPSSNISPLKRSRRISTTEEDEPMEIERKRSATGPFGILASALQRAQSQGAIGANSISTANRRSTGTMIADGIESRRDPDRVSVRQRLSSPPRLTPKTSDGFRVLVTQLNDTVTTEDLKELFSSVGPLKDAYLIEPGLGEAVFVRRSDAELAVKEFHNRELDGVPMHCQILSSITVTSGKRNPKQSTTTLTGRFRGADNEVQIPESARGASSKIKSDLPDLDPDRDLITSVLFGSKSGLSNNSNKVTFTVKV